MYLFECMYLFNIATQMQLKSEKAENKFLQL